MVTTGTREPRTACLATTRGPEKPRARAPVTWGFSSSPITAERVMRLARAIEERPSATAGRVRWSSRVTKEPMSPPPSAGNHWSSTPKTTAMTTPLT